MIPSEILSKRGNLSSTEYRLIQRHAQACYQVPKDVKFRRPLAEALDTISTHRPFRPGLGVEAALAAIERGRGSAYDADVVDACLRLFRDGRYQLPA